MIKESIYTPPPAKKMVSFLKAIILKCLDLNTVLTRLNDKTKTIKGKCQNGESK